MKPEEKFAEEYAPEFEACKYEMYTLTHPQVVAYSRAGYLAGFKKATELRDEREKSIYNLKLHEILPVETEDKELWTSAMRVHGGWIYRSYDKSHSMMSCVFVPESKESVP